MKNRFSLSILRYISASAVGFCASAGMAQQELMLYQSAELWQANAVNPAVFSQDKVLFVGSPSWGLDAAHSGDIAYNDLLRRQEGRTVLNLGGAINRLSPENRLRLDQRNERVSAGLRLGKWYLSAGWSQRTAATAVYPRALAELLWYGNGPYVGQTLDIGPAVDVVRWNELSAGLARHFGKNLCFGLRLKYLSGDAMLASDQERRRISIYTAPDIYQLSLQTDYGFYASGFISAVDTSGFGYDIAFNALRNRFAQNAGMALDAGITVRISERFTLSASALDLGSRIRWKSNTNYFHSQGQFQHDGVFIPGTDILNGTVDSLDFGAALDSLNDVLNFQKTAAELTTPLPARYYAAAQWQLFDRLRLGVVLHHQREERRQTTAVGCSGHWAVLPWLTAGAMYSINDRSATNIGLSAIVRLGPLQAFALSDNALNALTPYRSAAVNFRFGAALVF
jgi:hypothetical protein